MKEQGKKWGIAVIAAAVLVLFDQITKNWAVANLKDQADIVWIKGVFRLHYLENTGMAFGMFKNQQLFFYIMTALILGAILYTIAKLPFNRRFMALYLVLVVISAGAVGNLIDRASQQYVVDFLYFCLIDFPVFNIADCYVTVGCIVLVILLFFVYKDEEFNGIFKKAKTDTNEQAEG